MLPYGQMSFWGEFCALNDLSFFNINPNNLIYSSILPFIAPNTKSTFSFFKNRLFSTNSNIVPEKIYNDLDSINTKDLIKKELKNVAGINAFQKIGTNEIVYIGSSKNIANRYIQHINNGSSNKILQQGFEKK